MIVKGKSGERFVVFQLGDSMETLKREIFQVSLENNGGNIAAAARAMKICYRTAKNWRKQWELEPEDYSNARSVEEVIV